MLSAFVGVGCSILVVSLSLLSLTLITLLLSLLAIISTSRSRRSLIRRGNVRKLHIFELGGVEIFPFFFDLWRRGHFLRGSSISTLLCFVNHNKVHETGRSSRGSNPLRLLLTTFPSATSRTIVNVFFLFFLLRSQILHAFLSKDGGDRNGRVVGLGQFCARRRGRVFRFGRCGRLCVLGASSHARFSHAGDLHLDLGQHDRIATDTSREFKVCFFRLRIVLLGVLEGHLGGVVLAVGALGLGQENLVRVVGKLNIVRAEVAIDSSAILRFDAQEAHVAVRAGIFDLKVRDVVLATRIRALSARLSGFHAGKIGFVVALGTEARNFAFSVRMNDQLKVIEWANGLTTIGLETSVLRHAVDLLTVDAVEAMRFRVNVLHVASALAALGLETCIHLHSLEGRETSLKELVHARDGGHKVVVLLSKNIQRSLENVLVRGLAERNLRDHRLNVGSHLRKYQFGINAMVAVNESNAQFVRLQRSCSLVELDVASLNVLNVSGD